MIETETVEVGENTYQITQLGARQGRRMYHSLVQTVAPSLRSKLEDPKEIVKFAKAVSSIQSDGDGKVPVAEFASLVAVVLQAVESLPYDLFESLTTEFAKKCKVKQEGLFIDLGAGDLFDQHFAGKYSAMTQWFLACLKVNFADFLPSKVRDAV